VKRPSKVADPSSPRARIAAEAARLLAREEAASPDRARRKAAQRLGYDLPALLPSEAEVLQALRDYQRVFGEAADLPALEDLQRAASEALAHFADFDPELCSGLAEEPPRRERRIQLLLYSDDPDAPLHRLLEAGLAHRTRRGSLHAEGLGTLQVDHLDVAVGGVEFRLTPLPRRCRALRLRARAGGEVLPRVGSARWQARSAAAQDD
jgi:hypothetical protein